MFIKTAGFKKLISEAYKTCGLRVENNKNSIILSGGYWIIQIRKGMIPKKELAAIIELTGEIPKEDEAFTAYKGANQYEMTGDKMYCVMEKIENARKKLDVTDIIINRNGFNAATRVLQDPFTLSIHLIGENIMSIIDNSNLDEENCEERADGPYTGEYLCVLWYNNIMAFQVGFCKFGEQELLIKYLENIEISKLGEQDEHAISENSDAETQEETQNEHTS